MRCQSIRGALAASLSLLLMAVPPSAWGAQHGRSARLKAWLEPILAASNRVFFEVNGSSEPVPAIAEADLDGDGESDAIACVIRKDRADWQDGAAEVVIELSTGERFWLLPKRDTGPGIFPGCPVSFGSGKTAGIHVDLRGVDGRHVLTLGGYASGFGESYSVLFTRTGPRVIGIRYSTRFDSVSFDFQKLQSIRKEQDHSGEGPGETVALESAVLVAGPRPAPPSPLPTWVTWGKEQWSGDADAALRVSTHHDAQALIVQLRAQDDVVVPARDNSPKGILRADHFELWWSEGHQPVQLGVTLDGNGQPRATWFVGPQRSHALPRTTRVAGGIEVELPREWLERNGDGSTPFAVSYSDSDDPARGQQTLVSSTSHRPSRTDVGSLGRLWSTETEAGPMVLSDAFAPWRKLGPAPEVLAWLHQLDQRAEGE